MGHFLLHSLTPGICEYQGHSVWQSLVPRRIWDSEKKFHYNCGVSVISNSRSIFFYCEIIEKPESVQWKEKKKSWHLWEEQKMRENKGKASLLGPKFATLPYSDLVTMMRHHECSCHCIIFIFWVLVSVLNDNPWGIIFPETTSLFMDCLKLIVQISSDENKAQGIHVSSLQRGG